MNTLIFDQPANCWEEALPLGNGFLGAMIHGKVDREIIEINEDSLWSGAKMERRNDCAQENLQEIRELLKSGKVEEAQKLSVRSFFSKTPHSVHYQPLAQVYIEFHQSHGPINGYERSLQLETAMFSMRNSFGNDCEFMRESFISYPDNVMVYKLKTTKKEQLNFDLYLQRRDTRSGKTVSYLDSINCVNDTIYLSGYNGNRQEGIDYTCGCRVEIVDGTIKQYGTRLVIEKASEVTIYVTGRTSYRSENPLLWCEQHLNKISRKSYADLKEAHIRDYQLHYDKMNLEFPDTQNLASLSVSKRLANLRKGNADPQLLSLYFNFARYLMIASSREGSLPANLQGIWANEFEPSWGSKYTININLQMNYWLVEKVGLSSLHLPLLEFLERMLPSAKATAKAIYQSNGACAHHNTDIWCDCDPMDFNSASTIWPFGYLWLTLHVMEHFQYTRDEAFIRRFFPILKENMQFLLDYLFIDQNGYYASGPSVSPENSYRTKDGQVATICMSPTMDIQLITEFLTQYLLVCEWLKEECFQVEAKHILKHLPPIRIGKHDQILEWQEEYEEVELGHRHISHLFGLYPGTQIRWDQNPDLMVAAGNTLKRRLEHGGGHTGWSCAWIIHFFARLKDKNQAHDMLMKLLCESTLDNLFDNCPPFQIDGNFGGANAILEMIVQDYTDKVLILPAVSQQLANGKLENFVLKSGAKLSMEWEDCQVINLKVQATRPCKMTLDLEGTRVVVVLEAKEEYFYVSREVTR